MWLTPSADDARGWGRARAMRAGYRRDLPDGSNEPTVPVHVYEVDPEHPQQDRNGHWKAKSARIKRRLND